MQFPPHRFEPQTDLLDLDNFTAATALLDEIECLMFFNAGPMSGASQRHKHLQAVPLHSLAAYSGGGNAAATEGVSAVEVEGMEEGTVVPIQSALVAAGKRHLSTPTSLKPFRIPTYRFPHACVLFSDAEAGVVVSAEIFHRAYRTLLRSELSACLDDVRVRLVREKTQATAAATATARVRGGVMIITGEFRVDQCWGASGVPCTKISAP